MEVGEKGRGMGERNSRRKGGRGERESINVGVIHSTFRNFWLGKLTYC